MAHAKKEDPMTTEEISLLDLLASISRLELRFKKAPVSKGAPPKIGTLLQQLKDETSAWALDCIHVDDNKNKKAA